jgi:hypothetical protein
VGPGVTGATRRRGHKPDPPGRGRTDRGFIGGIGPCWYQLAGTCRLGPVGRRTATYPGARDQSGEAAGCVAGDRGRSLAPRYDRGCRAARSAGTRQCSIARSGLLLVLAPPPVPPLRNGDVMAPGGLAGLGAKGAPAACSTMVGAAWPAGMSTGARAGAVTATARTRGAASGTVTAFPAGACHRVAAPCAAGPARGRDTEVSTGVRSFGTPTAFTRVLRLPSFAGGWTGNRGTGRAESTFVTLNPAVGGTPRRPPESRSDEVAPADGSAPTSPTRLVPARLVLCCPGSSSARSQQPRRDEQPAEHDDSYRRAHHPACRASCATCIGDGGHRFPPKPFARSDLARIVARSQYTL